ncbi:MAG: ABC transporter ATP-binding protein [Actinomycetota bacterium]
MTAIAPSESGARPSAEATRILECRGLEKSYGDRRAVAGVGFEIAAGETYGLLGPNGAGKTTTISMICGLLARDEGEVTVDGRPLTTSSTDAKSAIGYVPQDLAIYPDLTAKENLTFFGRLYGMPRGDLKRRSSEVLEVTGLADRAEERTSEFSGGMKRRLNIGIALLHKPQLLVLDEPTVGVDPQSRNAILSSVETLSEAGMAVLYTTHYMEEAERLCDRVGIIDEGEIKAEGTRRELVAILGERDRVGLDATGDIAGAVRSLSALDMVEEATSRESGLDLILGKASRHLPQILEVVAEAGAEVTSVNVVEPDLEAVFLKLTGKALRD